MEVTEDNYNDVMMQRIAANRKRQARQARAPPRPQAYARMLEEGLQEPITKYVENRLEHRTEDIEDGTLKPERVAFTGYLLNSKARRYPAAFTMEPAWMIADLTDIHDVNHTFRVHGNVPYVQPCVVYRLELQQKYRKKSLEWQWTIMSLETCAPLYHSTPLRKFVNTFGLPLAPNPEVHDVWQTSIAREFARGLRKNYTSALWAVLLESTEWGKAALTRLQSPNNRADRVFPLLTIAYDGDALFRSKFWQGLKDAFKHQWEYQIGTSLQTAYRHCFADELERLYPDERRLRRGQSTFGNRKAAGKGSKTKAKGKSSTASSSSASSNAPLAEFDGLPMPEMTARGLQSLCQDRGWHLAAVEYIDRVRAYGQFRTKLNEHHDCCLPLQSFPPALQAPLLKLWEEGILQCKTFEGEGRFLLLASWNRAKTSLSASLNKITNPGSKSPALLQLRPTFDQGKVSEVAQQLIAQVQQHPVSCLVGPAGTGKTELIKTLHAAFSNIIGVAFLCMAVENMRQRVPGLECLTMHSCMMTMRQRRGHSQQDCVFDLVIIDEASMPAESLMVRFLQAVPTRRLLLVGDPNQIPPFGPGKGNILPEFIRTFPTLKLEKIYRQNENSLILPNAMRVLQGDVNLKFDRDTFFIRPVDVGVHLLLERHFHNRYADFQFITATNRQAEELNMRCLERLRQDIQARYTKTAWPVGRDMLRSFAAGERIMFTEKVNRAADDVSDDARNNQYYVRTGQVNFNTRQLFVNGEQAVIRLIENNKTHTNSANDVALGCCVRGSEGCSAIRLVLECGRVVTLFDEFVHGYAATTNKIQGTERAHIALYTRSPQSSDHGRSFFSKNHTYTAITRAKQSFCFLGALDELRALILNQPRSCHCYLQQWIREQSNNRAGTAVSTTDTTDAEEEEDEEEEENEDPDMQSDDEEGVADSGGEAEEPADEDEGEAVLSDTSE